MSDKIIIEGCTVTEDGHCAMHGAEVERRKNSQKEIEDIKGDIKSNKVHIGNLLTFMNNFNGQRTVIAGVALMIVFGSYSYTFITANAANGADQRYERALAAQERSYQIDIQDIRWQLGLLDTRVAVTDEKYRSVMSQLKILNTTLSQLIGIINEERSVKKIQLQETLP